MATQIVKSFQSEGGFSVKEATIIDENRHVIDAASVKFKTEQIQGHLKKST